MSTPPAIPRSSWTSRPPCATPVQGRDGISLRKTHPRHLDAQRLRPDSAAFVGSAKNDQNKVDIDQQMANLSENTGRYTTYGSLLVKHFQIIKTMLANER